MLLLSMQIPGFKDNTQNGLISLIIIMVISIVFILTVTLTILYSVAFNENEERLQELAQSQSIFIDSFAKYQLSIEKKTKDEVYDSILLQLNDAYSHYFGFKKSGEFIFGRKVGNSIEFLLTVHNQGGQLIIPINSDLAEPMERAVSGQSGVIIGKDYKGVTVLAAYEYIPNIDIGVVAKINIEEINKPFADAIKIVSVISMFIIFFSAMIFNRIRIGILDSIKIQNREIFKANKKLKYEILEHHETEIKLKETTAKLREVIKQSPIPMVITSVDQHIDFYNDKFTEVFGYSKDDFINESYIWDKFFPDRNYRTRARSAWLISLERFVNRKKKLPKSVWSITTKSGDVKICEVYIVVTMGTSFVVFNDITEQKKLEKQLISAKEEAEELSEAKSNFLSTVSHEIRTPINGVLGMNELLQDTGLTSEQKKYSDSIKISGNILLGLVNDLLDISKIEANMLKLEAISFNLYNLLTDFIESQKYKTRGKDLDLTLDVRCNLPDLIIGDPIRLRQILLNLIGNALKFTERGFVKVLLYSLTQDEKSIELKFEIADSGIGIEQEKFDYIFEKFTQADISTTRRFGGTGLGLAITRELVEAMGGSISVESKIGVGSTFTFTVRMLKGDETKVVTEFDSELNLLDKSNVSPIVLVADDNIINQKVAKGILEKHGCIVDIASDGIDCLELLMRKKYDVVLMDCNMPELDGYSATKAVRNNKDNSLNKNVPILAMTANVTIEDREKCYSCGMNDFIPKPVEPDTLMEIIKRYIN